MNNEQIRSNFIGVYKDTKKLTQNQLNDKYKDFKEKYEKLFDVAVNSAINNNIQESLKILDMMLNAKNKLDNGTITPTACDMFVGNQLGHTYIYPKTNVPSRDDYKKAVNQIIHKQETQ